jgi:hypothetical protein
VTAIDHPTPSLERSPSRVRDVSARLLALAIIALFSLPEIPKMFSVWVESDLAGSHRVHTLGEASHSAVIILVAALAIVLGRGNIAPVQTLLVGVLLPLPLFVLTGVVDDLGIVAVFVALFVGLALLHPDRSRLREAQPSVPLLAIAAVAAVPMLWFGWTELRLQYLLPATEPHAAVGHYAGTAFFMVSLVAIGILAALRTPGWRYPMWTVSITTVLMAVMSLLNPRAASAWDPIWAVAALLGAATFVLVGSRTTVRPAGG